MFMRLMKFYPQASRLQLNNRRRIFPGSEAFRTRHDVPSSTLDTLRSNNGDGNVEDIHFW